jgi:hypothetical protein
MSDHCRLPTADCQLPIANCRLASADSEKLAAKTICDSSRLRDLCDLCVEKSIDEKRACLLKYFVEFFRGHFSNCAKTDTLFDRKKALRPDEACLTDLATFTVGIVERNGERIPVCAAGYLTQNQICAWKIGNDQGGTLSSGSIVPWKRYGDNFAGYRFDHATSSSGEFQSRARTDSLSCAPLNGSSTS